MTVAGPTAYVPAAVDGSLLAAIESATVAELVHEMLQNSDNQIADMLVKDVGAKATGRGSMESGAAATRDALAPLCVPLTGTTDDGSGLSRGNTRSARELRSVVQAARAAPWWPILFDALPRAGRSGTLAARFRGTAAEDNVRAKTGTIIGGAALSGTGTTASGRAFVFSVIVNGPTAGSSAGAIDGLIAAIAGSGA